MMNRKFQENLRKFNEGRRFVVHLKMDKNTTFTCQKVTSKNILEIGKKNNDFFYTTANGNFCWRFLNETKWLCPSMVFIVRKDGKKFCHSAELFEDISNNFVFEKFL